VQQKDLNVHLKKNVKKLQLRKSKFKRCGKVHHYKKGHKKCQSKTCCFYKRVCSELDGYKKCKTKKKFGCKAKTKCQKN